MEAKKNEKCNKVITNLEAKDFKVNIGGKSVKVTKAEFHPTTGGYFLEWDEDIIGELIQHVITLQKQYNALEKRNNKTARDLKDLIVLNLRVIAVAL